MSFSRSELPSLLYRCALLVVVRFLLYVYFFLLDGLFACYTFLRFLVFHSYVFYVLSLNDLLYLILCPALHRKIKNRPTKGAFVHTKTILLSDEPPAKINHDTIKLFPPFQLQTRTHTNHTLRSSDGLRQTMLRNHFRSLNRRLENIRTGFDNSSIRTTCRIWDTIHVRTT